MRADLPDYEVARPRDLDDALQHLADAPGRWTPLAGGTDLMVVLAAGHLKPCALLSIWHLDALRGITVTPDRVELGALATYSELQRHPVMRAEFPMLVEAARLSGAAAIQNRGTIAGNVANASPAADSPPALLAYDAQLELASVRGRRRVQYSTFHTGYKASLRAPDELVTAVVLPRPSAPRIDAYRKVGTRKAQAIAKIGLAASVRMDAGVIAEIRLGLSSVAPIPLCAEATATALRGRTPADGMADGIAALAREVCPIDDVRSTAGYRRAVAVGLLRDLLGALARGEHPAGPL
ncbi:MAG TPA: FAD binding domain-containing protein [Nannocystaceae bacterium]|nr:FAD binding domain-containing protein [Nannocystaceae bacterium]